MRISGLRPALNTAAASGAPAGFVDGVDAWGQLVAVANLAPQADGWVQFAPFGDFPIVLGEGEQAEEVVQAFNAETGASLVADFQARKGSQIFYVDQDHASDSTAANTAASAWVKDMQVRADGVYMLPEWTSTGKALVDGKVYKFGSPVVSVRNSGRKDAQGRRIVLPVMIGTPGTRTFKALPIFALTNTPNIREIKPVFNRAPNSAGMVPAGNKDNDKMKTELLLPLLALLSLPAESEPTAALNAVQALKDKAGKVDELIAALNAAKEEKVQGALAEYADVIPAENKADFESLLRCNYSCAIAGLKAIRNAAKATKPAGTVTPLHNRATAGTPEPNKLTATKTGLQNAKVAAIQSREKCDFQSAWNMAKAESPDLFAAEES